MTCPTCKGAGHVPGHWMPELCPACSGHSEPLPMSKDEKDINGCLVVTLLFVVCLLAALAMAVWKAVLA